MFLVFFTGLTDFSFPFAFIFTFVLFILVPTLVLGGTPVEAQYSFVYVIIIREIL